MSADWTSRLRLRHLQILVSLAQTQNISHSAEQLHMTQPALSKWLKDLEADIGLSLFERHARGLRPTAHGQVLREFALGIGNQLDRARDEMAALRSGGSGRVVVGASGAAIGGVVPQAVSALLRAMPNANVQVREAPMDRLFQQLAQGEVDVAVGRAALKYHHPEIHAEVLYEERLHFAVRPEHPLARRRSLSWSQLQSQRWVVWTSDIPARELLESSLAAVGQGIPASSVQSNSLLATIAMVAESDMVAAVSERAIALPARWKMLKRLPLRLDTLSEITMYWRTQAQGLAAVDGLLDALRRVSAQAARP